MELHREEKDSKKTVFINQVEMDGNAYNHNQRKAENRIKRRAIPALT